MKFCLEYVVLALCSEHPLLLLLLPPTFILPYSFPTESFTLTLNLVLHVYRAHCALTPIHLLILYRLLPLLREWALLLRLVLVALGEALDKGSKLVIALVLTLRK